VALEERMLEFLTVGRSFVEYEACSEVGRLIEVLLAAMPCSNLIESLKVTPMEWRCGFLAGKSVGRSLGGLPRTGRYRFISV
jgi:hypothetical protein